MKELLIAIFSVPFCILAASNAAFSQSVGPNPALVSATAPAPTTLRSVRLNNMHNWGLTGSTPSDAKGYDAALDLLAKRDCITYSEVYEYPNDLSGWRKISTASIRAIHPDAKIYRWYDLMCKNNWDSDWSTPDNATRMQTPLTKAQIDTNDWWLRDGNGIIVKESDSTWLLDVGKPGFKEAFLQNTLTRLSGLGFDGVTFDYWWPGITNWMKGQPRPAAYPTDNDWFTKAWQPFINYVMDGLHSAGYRIVGNCVGEYGDQNPVYQFQRSKVDAMISEQWALSFAGQGANWLPGSTIERRINILSADPLEVWAVDEVPSTDQAFNQKHLVSLAMYYIAMPGKTQTTCYCCSRDFSATYQPIWDFYIGAPSGSAAKNRFAYFWTRKFGQGLVVLNYEAQKSITIPLNVAYRDPSGNVVTGKLTVPPHTGRILSSKWWIPR